MDPTQRGAFVDGHVDLASWRGVAHPPSLDIEFLGGEMVTYELAATAPVFG